MSRFRDFDQAVSALEPVRFRIGGRDYELSPDVPADKVWRMIREGRGTDAQANAEIIDDIIGRERMNQMLADGATMRQVGALVSWILEEYRLAIFNQPADEPTVTAGTNGAVPK